MENPYQLRDRQIYPVHIKWTKSGKKDKRIFACQDRAREVFEELSAKNPYSICFYESGWRLYTHINYSSF